MNLVRVDEVHARALLLMASKEQLNRTGIVADADAELTSEQINQALRDVAPENDRLEAEIAAAVAAEQKEAREEEEARSNDKKKKTKKKKKNKANKRHPTLSVTAGQVLEAAANLGLDQLQNVRDLGQRMGSGVFTEVADACDRLTVGLRAMADKTCDKLELYLLNNVLRIPDDLHVPSVDNKKEDSVSTLSAPGTHMYSQEEETAIDDERAVLRDRIVRLRRKNARVARARADLHVQLEKWQSVMPLINEVTSQISKAMDSEDTENKSGTGVALSDAVMNVLRTTAQLTKKSSQVQGEPSPSLYLFICFYVEAPAKSLTRISLTFVLHLKLFSSQSLSHGCSRKRRIGPTLG